MSEINGYANNLRGQSVRPLRYSSKPRAEESGEQPVRRFSVDELKNGGSLDLSGAAQGRNQGEEEATIRQRYRGRGPAPSARQAHNSELSVEEQIQKLAKIRQSAVEYESVFVDQLVKQMRQSPLTKTPGSDTFSDIAEQPFRDFLSQAGGLGLADSIVGQVARQEGLEQTLHEYPDIMGPNWRPKISPNLMKKSPGGLEIAPGNKGPETAREEAKAAPETARPDQPAPAKPEKKAAVGLMDSEEIAWLYQDASAEHA